MFHLRARFAFFLATSASACLMGAPVAYADDPAFPGVVAPTETASHWGVGLAAVSTGEIYRGDSNKITPFPLVLYDSEYIHFFGNTFDVKLPSYGDVDFAVRAKYGVGAGYKASDSSYLNGMAERKAGVSLGFAATTKTSFGTFSADWQKLPSDNKGQQVQIGAEWPIKQGKFEFVPHVGIDWADKKYVDYYYGVQPNEVTAARKAYSGNAATNLGVGIRVNYALTRNQLLVLDVSDTHYAKNITDSPLVDKTTAPSIKFGYLYQFK